MLRSVCVSASIGLSSTLLAVETNVSLPRFPSVSPDGSRVAFSWRGDIWSAPAAGGDAVRLTSHPADELYSAFGPDGKQIAFTSTRNGYQNIYLMNADGTGIRQISNVDRAVSLWSFCNLDGAPVVVFQGRLELDEFPGFRPYALPLSGGEPLRLFDAFASNPSVSPDGRKILFTRGGSGWSRRGYRGPDARDLWLYDRTTKAYTQLTQWNGNDGRARWIDNGSFVYASDRNDGTVNLYKRTLGQPEDQAQRLTRFDGTDVEDFDISADGSTLVFASWDRLYRIDLANAGDGPRAIVIRGTEDAGDRTMLKTMDRTVSESALSPDGKTMAVIAYGQVYVRGTEGKSPARRLTSPPARHSGVAWSPDGQSLYFTSDTSGKEQIFQSSVLRTRGEVKKEFEKATRAATQPAAEPATQPATDEAPATQPAAAAEGKNKEGKAEKEKKDDSRWPDAISFDTKLCVTSDSPVSDASPSPDGKHLAYRRGLGQLWVRDLAAGDDRKLVDGWSEQLTWRWSPDSRHLAYVTEDVNNNSDVWIIPADASVPAVNISRHPDNDDQPRWSADGKLLAMVSNRVNNESDVYTVFLDKSLEIMTPRELEKYYEDASAAAKKREPLKPQKASTQPTSKPGATAADSDASTQPATPAKLDLDDAYLRLRRITTMPGNEGDVEITPAGDRIIFTAQSGAARATFSVEKDGGEPKRLAAVTDVRGTTLSGDKVVVVESNRAALMKLPAGELEYLDISDKLPIDLTAQSEQKFREAARILGQVYYDPKLNGLDWPKLTERYASLARLAATNDEFDHVATKFVGELNGSHLGINSPDEVNPLTQPMGRLGIKKRRVDAGYEVIEIFEQGPAGKGIMRLQAGDVITQVEGRDFGQSDTLGSALTGRSGKETLLTIRRKGDGGTKELNVLITPVSAVDESVIFYNDWRVARAARVAEMSGGKIGYIHVRGMDQGSLDIFERDLYAAADGKRGLIIDVRNNGGGWTADRLLAAIMYPRHAYTRPRGVSGDVTDAYPNDRLFIARYDLPINMLCNEKSFSNAEIIAHAFKTLKRGTLVGQQTAGGVISTGGTTLLDGTTVRLPGRGWFTPDGRNMELNGAMPDLVVPQTPEAEAAETDEQLKAAVEDLLKRVK